MKIIYNLTKGAVKPKVVEKSVENLKKLLIKHPLISPIEICEAFDFENLEEVEKFISPLIEKNLIGITKVKHSYFIESKL